MSSQSDLEIAVSHAAGFSDASSPVGEKAKEAFESLGSLLSEAVAPLRQKLAETAESADEIELKLDLALKAGGKWVVISMEGTATVSVKLVWKKTSP
ncbi:CU044_2847 family protein [Ideonella sp. DXS29W]|uniref:CU044_2847 family protein n=1 Tax=Ideonella lacteola TaxID=2984193 RepID=A0ABU9BY18_9BURK